MKTTGILIKFSNLAALFLLFAIGSSLGQDYVLQVGNAKYSDKDIYALMQTNHFTFPEQAVEKLRTDEIINNYAREHKVIYSEARNGLFSDAFGKDINQDEVMAKALDLQKASALAMNRLYMFNAWLSHKAQKIPVVYLDVEKFWDMVKTTDAYRVRVSSGQKLSSANIPYTFAELQTKPENVLATKDNEPYITGKEFNAFVLENYDGLIDFVKRSKTLGEARDYILQKSVGEKIIAESEDVKSMQVTDVEAERLISSYVVKHQYNDDLHFVGKEYAAIPDMMKDYKSSFYTNHDGDIKLLRQALKGETQLAPEPFLLKNSFQKAVSSFRQKAIAASITEKELYDWMKTEKFPGNSKEARFVLSNNKFREYQNALIKKNNVSILSFGK